MPRAANLCRLLLIAILWLALGPAQAHSPYFQKTQTILLPNGERGEMRIIAGDGIIFADPVRIVILDEQNRLIARSPRTQWLSLVCDRPLHCHGYDHGSGEVIVPDPATFGKDGPLVHPVDERDDLWEIEGGDAVWGVTVRPATWREWLSVEGAAFRSASPSILSFFAILGVIAGLCWVGVRAPGWTGRQTLLWLAGLALRLTFCAAVLIVLLGAIAMGDTVPSLMFGPFLIGVLLAWLLGPRIGRRLRSALVSARRRAPPEPAP